MKNKLLLALVALSCARLVLAGNDAAYPSEKLAQFVVDRLDVTSLPSAFRPKKERGKKTFADYGFTTQSVGEGDATLTGPSAAGSVSINVLDQNVSGIYVCMAEPAQQGTDKRLQTVVLLKRKEPNANLKGRLTSREFAACPNIGAEDSSGSSY